MPRLWEIRESYGDRMSHKGHDGAEDMEISHEEREAYKCGYEDGYGDAMKYVQSSEHYGERYMGERGRMRDSMGRFR